MARKDSSDVFLSAVSVAADAAAVFSGFLLATWVRFDSGWLSLRHARPDNLYHIYAVGGAVATLVMLLVFRSAGLFVRPQTGSFPSKIPRLVKATGMGTILSAVLAFVFQNDVDVSRVVIGLAFICISAVLLLERWILYRIEWNVARHTSAKNRVLILGTDSVAAHVRRTLKREPMLRSRVIGFLQTGRGEPDPNLAPDEVLGTVTDLAGLLNEDGVDQVILTSSDLPRDEVLDIVLLCEQNMVTFNMVPDLFRTMTISMDVQSLDDIPLLGLGTWPLDAFWNRFVKRAEDLIVGVLGLLISAPVILVAAILIKRDSRGPIFFRQERCGYKGRSFMICKLRTMRVDAEAGTGPVFAREGDPRTTRVGAALRRLNIDELPQLWNVIRGDMSLVGPRPERPHFVEKFKTDVGRYMWRHVSKPGITGWAQVNGLRGNTSIDERIKYDLYYLEKWSLAFDFKILLRTLFARENAY